MMARFHFHANSSDTTLISDAPECPSGNSTVNSSSKPMRGTNLRQLLHISLYILWYHTRYIVQ